MEAGAALDRFVTVVGGDAFAEDVPLAAAQQAELGTGDEVCATGVVQPLGECVAAGHDVTLESGLLLATVVLAHPRRVADHRGVVRRDAVGVGEAVRPLDRGHPATGPLAVVRDEDRSSRR